MKIKDAQRIVNEYRDKSILSEEEEFSFIEALEFLIEKSKDTKYMIELGGYYYEHKKYDLAFKYYGEIGVSSLSVVFYFQFIMESIFMGFTSAVEPIFSYHYGSGDIDARKKVFKLSNIWIFVISILIIVVSFIFRNNIVDIFFDRGTEIYKITQLGFVISIFSTIFCGYNTFFSGLFTAFSNGLISGILSIARTFVILVISLYLMSYLFQGIGLWSAWPVAELAAFLFSIIFIIKYRNKYNYV